MLPGHNSQAAIQDDAIQDDMIIRWAGDAPAVHVRGVWRPCVRVPRAGPDDFARWLTCARLVAASALSPTVELAHYEHAMKMEAARLERLRKPAVEI